MRLLVKLGQGVSLAIALALSCTAAAADDRVVLKVSSFEPPTGLFTAQILVPFLDNVVADSEGTLDYKLYAGGTLGRSPVEQLKLVTDGVADMAFVIPSYTPGELNAYGVTEIPGLATNSGSASMALWDAYDAGLLPTPEGVVIVGLGTTFPQTLHSVKPISGPEDLKGLRHPAASAAQIETITELGATPVSNLRATEIAEGLSRGTIDATVLDFAAASVFRSNRLTDYYLTDLYFGAFALMLPMNEDSWNNLPPAARAAFDKHMGAEFARLNGRAFDAAEQTQREAQRAEGKTFVAFPETEIARIRDIFDTSRANWGATNDRQQAVLDHVTNSLASLN